MSSEVVYLALEINEEGCQKVLGFWVLGSNRECLLSRAILSTLKRSDLTEPFLVVVMDWLDSQTNQETCSNANLQVTSSTRPATSSESEKERRTGSL